MLETLERCRRYISAGIIDPSPADMVELCDLFMAAQIDAGDAVLAGRVAAYVKRVCPQVVGGVN